MIVAHGVLTLACSCGGTEPALLALLGGIGVVFAWIKARLGRKKAK